MAYKVPQVLLAVFCDQIDPSGDYGKDFLGVSAKRIVPAGTAFQVWAVVWFAGLGPGRHQLRRTFTLDDGTELQRDEHELQFRAAGDTETIATHMTFNDLPAGILWMNVSVDERLLVRSPLTIAEKSAGVDRRSFAGTPLPPAH